MAGVAQQGERTHELADGHVIPMLGLGVWQVENARECVDAVRWALEEGYRHIDTAQAYGNEESVGLGLRESGVPRDEIFVTTKLWNDDHGYESALRAFEESRKELGVDAVDLYLIHWPVPGKRDESWKALLKLKEQGVVRSVGVSNYTIRHLEELLSWSPRPPSVNQVEFHPFLYQKELLEYCQRKGIQAEAYSPLARGERFNHPRIITLATKYSKTPAQLMLRWGLQHGLVVIPKSTGEERIRENSQVFDFEISSEDMRSLDSLNEGLRLNWDPTSIP